MALRDTAIVGYAETKIVEKSDRDVWELGAEILETLLDKTGFEKGEIDGLILSSSMTGAGNCFWSQTTADQLALEIDFCQTVDIGGCSPLGAVARAAAAIDAGLCTTVMCLFADTQAAENNGRMRAFHNEWTVPLGYIGPPAAFGLLSRRYEHQFGLDYAALGKLAVAQRGHALLNELAVEKLRKPITVEDYLNSRMIADPIRLLMCSAISDGAAAVVVSSKPGRGRVRVRASALASSPWRLDPGALAGPTLAADKAYAQAGVGPSELHLAEVHDAVSPAELMHYRELRLCREGEVAKLVAEKATALGGRLPVNTSGGLTARGPPVGATGGAQLIELTLQLRGDAGPRQVQGARLALAHNSGGWIGEDPAVSAVHILEGSR